MKAVFSFFDTTGEPLKSARNWLSPRFFLYSWVLAVHSAARDFEEVELVTDSKCKKLFEKLQLPFTSIRTDLDSMVNYPKEFWALGKVKAYQIQEKPFVHLDNDVIFFNTFPDKLRNAQIGFQNKEGGDWFERVYRMQIDRLPQDAILPKSWGKSDYAVNCGFYVCNDLEFNKEYCKQAFEFVDHNSKKLLAPEVDVWGHWCVVFEQYIAGCVAEDLKTPITYLSENHVTDQYNEHQYVHIWGEKKNEKWLENIEIIVKRDYEKYYEKINNILKQEL